MKNNAKETKERLSSYSAKWSNKSDDQHKKAYKRFLSVFNKEQSRLSSKGIDVSDKKAPSFEKWKFYDKSDYVERLDEMYTGQRKTLGNRQRDIAKKYLSAGGAHGGSVKGYQKLLRKYGYKVTMEELKHGMWKDEISQIYKLEKEKYALDHPELNADEVGFGSRFSEHFSQEWFDSK